ncbi:glucosamine-6-phosphate deaminase [Arthrobacter sp. AK01]|uniref:glucosamine-6-phosphate deaminase n=1 Tax=Micrococcaceae TaxID=1268 RepID=UPI001E4832B8|nr:MULTISPECIES: glucosamine-6-phosphate deaminase [Micrococcaceae]MCD4849449.1 glucosamine-6-phosphate deaminase [Arthrobacter sp. AK01]MCP1410948.1 glucosamine-6-phosphate deaminase [Paenarthrobacter sp. A20]
MAEIIIVRDHTEAGSVAASIFAQQIIANPATVLGLATGSTPLSTYAALARTVRRDRIDVSGVRGFALDEYLGVPPQHPESYRSVITREVVEPLGLNPNQVFTPRGTGSGITQAGAEYEAMIADAGGVDIQILGIGSNGHVGFNEPGSSLASSTRIKALAAQTRKDNARFFSSPDEVPTHCITQGLGTILRARRLVLLAFGANKAQAVAAALEGPVSSAVPGSVIQQHARATVIIDEDAAAGLAHAEYYRHAWQSAQDLGAGVL